IAKFNAQDQELQNTREEFEGGQWEAKSRNIYTYAPNGKIASWSKEAYNGSWEKINRYIYDYHPTLQLITVRTQQTYEGGTYLNKDRNLYDYDAAGNTIKREQQNWDGGSWEGSWKRELTYDAQNREISMIFYTHPGLFYEFSYRQDNTYNNQDQLVEELIRDWVGLSWVNDRRDTFIYAGQQLTIRSEEWGAASWAWKKQEIITHNGAGEKIQSVKQQWSDGWQGLTRIKWGYGDQGELTLREYADWDQGVWALTDRYLFYYLSASTTPIQTLLQTGLKIGPNPASDVLRFHLETPLQDAAVWEIVDLQGRQVSVQHLHPGATHYQWTRPAQVANGMYISRIHLPEGLFQEKIMLSNR
ncbi:MAG: T9SS type A sorting domain-containing protein, partial [Bacteroidota bacterium]